MALVPAGTFTMGDGAATCGWDQRQVTLTCSFYLSKYEVSNKEYRDALQWAYDRAFVTATESAVSDNLDGSTVMLVDLAASACQISFSGGTFAVDPGKDSYPMIEVSWYGAVAYCDWLSIQVGLLRAYDHSTWDCNVGDPYATQGYRLPTDAEWEYATQYSGERLYPWGDQSPDCSMANFYDGSGHYCVGHTTPVGSYPGWTVIAGDSIYDMAGNVWEWCNDWHTCDLGTEPVLDPPGSASGSYRMLRGASWHSAWQDLNCACRYRWEGHYPSWTNDRYGFRIARSQ
jgi:formylglycine-generating enzyme required for sulfatase activity